MSSSDPKAWQVIHSEYLHREPWFTARKDHVRLPSGVEIPDYYVLEYPDWVNTLAITENQEFVLIRQYRHGIGETRFELCAGVCDPHESPLEAAQRELLEETGFGGGDWSLWMTLSANAGTMNNKTYCFLATGVHQIQKQKLEKTEDITVHLLSEQEIIQILEQDEVRQSLMAAPLWKYMALRNAKQQFYAFQHL